jgi:hypothetical protein
MIDDMRGADVNEVVRRVESFNPKSSRKLGLDKEGAYYVICGSKHALGFTILGRGVRTR